MKDLAATIALVLVVMVPLPAQSPPSVLRGSWSATVGTSRVLRGTWSATLDSASPDRAVGTWALLDDGNRLLLEGTWSADKGARGWQGTWSARVTPRAGRSAPARTLSGTWRADIKDPNIRTLAGLLQHAVIDQVSGTWRSGALGGGWRLKN